jgi:hypothetical protein
VPTVRPAVCGIKVRKKEGQKTSVDFLKIDIVVSHPGVKTGVFSLTSPPVFPLSLFKERGTKGVW